MTTTISSTFALQSDEVERAAAREAAKRELQRMSETMVAEKGLLNHAQAALLLDVSTKRVGELVRLGKLSDFTFLGRKYVSMREVCERNTQDLKAGRPGRGIGKRATASIKAALQTDKVQGKLGGYAGPYVRAQREAKKKKWNETEKEFWRKLIGKGKKS